VKRGIALNRDPCDTPKNQEETGNFWLLFVIVVVVVTVVGVYM